MTQRLISTDIFIIPLHKSYLIYAPLRRLAFIGNSAAVNAILRWKKGQVALNNTDEAKLLHFCQEICLVGEDDDFPISTMNNADFSPTEVTLFLTNRCNLRCIYCYASSGEHRPVAMSLNTAKRGIDYACRNALAQRKPSFEVGYHGGGEPTMNWKVLIESFSYAQNLAKENGIKVNGSMATNGVLSGEKRRWIIQNFKGVNISTDGIPEVQDNQRPLTSGKGSSKAILQTINCFKAEKYPFGIRLTVTQESVKYLVRSVEYILETGTPVRMQIEPVYLLGRGCKAELEVNSQEFVESYHRAKIIADQAGTEIFYSAARIEVLTNRFCQSCGEGFSLTPQGLVSSCYEVPDKSFEYGNEFIIGKFDELKQAYVINWKKLNKLRKHTVESIPWCHDCFCKWHCGGDCTYKAKHVMVNGKYRGDPRCEITRALTLDQILAKIAQNGGVYWAENKTTIAAPLEFDGSIVNI